MRARAILALLFVLWGIVFGACLHSASSQQDPPPTPAPFACSDPIDWNGDRQINLVDINRARSLHFQTCLASDPAGVCPSFNDEELLLLHDINAYRLSASLPPMDESIVLATEAQGCGGSGHVMFSGTRGEVFEAVKNRPEAGIGIGEGWTVVVGSEVGW